MELAEYRAEAEAFSSAISREYQLQGSGQKDDLELEGIYARHADLFTREAVAERTGELALFAAEGLIGRETRTEAAELARLEATLEVEGMPFRQAAVAQACEADPGRRAELEAARLAVTEEHLNPLLLRALERSHALSADLGWPSFRAMCEELAGLDLGALRDQTQAFLTGTDPADAGAAFEAETGVPWAKARRSDLPAFFRARSLDSLFPDGRLLDAYRRTRAALGLTADGVRLDAEARPKKSPRAFCAPVRIPEEVHLVIPRLGGREDYEALMHEAGHAEHFAHVDPSLPFEDRWLGDNSVTEGYAFLFQHLVRDARWLRTHLDVEDAEAVERHGAAERLLFLRRYCAKLDYELELHGGGELEAMPAAYSSRLSAATGVDWPQATWLSDVDGFFYAARYLRAWAFEGDLAARLGEAWWERPEAGAQLVELWRIGQSKTADELAGAPIDFSRLLPASTSGASR